MAKNKTGRARVKGKNKSASAVMIKEFREEKGLSPEGLAALLGLNGTRAIYAWERGSYEPSAETYIDLLKLGTGADWKYTKHFLTKLGLDAQTIGQLSERSKEIPENSVMVQCLDDEIQTLAFPRSLLERPNSTRFIRVHSDDEGYFNPGDVILLDISETNLSKMKAGSFLAVSGPHTVQDKTGVVKSGTYRNIGWLVKMDAMPGILQFMLRWKQGQAIHLGSSENGHDRVHEHLTVLGRVVAWLALGGHLPKASD